MSSTPPRPPFAAVLLAGGRSTRMGQDKAGVLIDGQPLWQLQLARLRTLEPAELFISGHANGPYAGAAVEIVTDAIPGLGPLGGIAAALARATSPLLLVLAIDLPAMSTRLLASLLEEARTGGCGIVPRQSGYAFEPLAAVYPRTALPFALESLRGADRSMQRFTRRLIDLGLAAAHPILATQIAEFRNVNSPDDAAQSHARTHSGPG